MVKKRIVTQKGIVTSHFKSSTENVNLLSSLPKSLQHKNIKIEMLENKKGMCPLANLNIDILEAKEQSFKLIGSRAKESYKQKKMRI